ncbi:MAG: hypothetical protein JWQ88_1832 [Rhodoferax sp.]|nr:hypothetical protein [Rhodoferax sp.]
MPRIDAIGRKPLVVGVVLALTAGWVDSLGFIALFGLFTAHVTGNFVLLGRELAVHDADAAIKLLVLPAFVAGVACAGWISAALSRAEREAGGPLLLLEMAGLATFMAVGVLASPIRPDGAGLGLTMTAACAGTFAMGVQSAQSRLSLQHAGATTAMTGALTQLVIDGVGMLHLHPHERMPARERLGKTLATVAGFAAGCAGGGLAYQAWSFWALLVPICALGVLLACGCRCGGLNSE